MRASTGVFAGSSRGTSRKCRFLSAMRVLRGAPQILHEGVDGRSFGLHHPELADVGAKVVEDLLGPRALRLAGVRLDEALQMLQVRLHRFGVDAADVDELMIVAVDKIALEVEYVGKSPGEAGSEIDPGPAEHAHDSARHVLAAVIAGAFHHGDGAGVAHGEALSRDARREELAAGRAIEAGIAHDDGFLGDELGVARMAQHEFAARHALADIVVGIALEVEVQAAGVPDAKTLPGAAQELDDERRVLHAVVAPVPCDHSGYARADRAVEVPDVVTPPPA